MVTARRNGRGNKGGDGCGDGNGVGDDRSNCGGDGDGNGCSAFGVNGGICGIGNAAMKSMKTPRTNDTNTKTNTITNKRTNMEGFGMILRFFLLGKRGGRTLLQSRDFPGCKS